jgi:hypothetical protein
VRQKMKRRPRSVIRPPLRVAGVAAADSVLAVKTVIELRHCGQISVGQVLLIVEVKGALKHVG